MEESSNYKSPLSNDIDLSNMMTDISEVLKCHMTEILKPILEEKKCIREILLNMPFVKKLQDDNRRLFDENVTMATELKYLRANSKIIKNVNLEIKEMSPSSEENSQEDQEPIYDDDIYQYDMAPDDDDDSGLFLGVKGNENIKIVKTEESNSFVTLDDMDDNMSVDYIKSVLKSQEAAVTIRSYPVVTQEEDIDTDADELEKEENKYNNKKLVAGEEVEEANDEDEEDEEEVEDANDEDEEEEDEEEEDEEEEVEDANDEDEEDEEEEANDEEEEEDEEVEEDEEEEDEEEEEEEEDEEEDLEVEDVEIGGKMYVTTNMKNGTIYKVDKDGEIVENDDGDYVKAGFYKNGVPLLY